MAITVAARNTGTITSASTSWSITLPSSGAATGDLYVIVASPGAASTLTTTSSGWTKVGQGGTSASPIAIFTGIVGTASSTLTIASSASVLGAYAGVRVTGVTTTGLAFAFASGSTTTQTPPSLTPSGGSGQYLWLVVQADDQGGNLYQPSTAPSGWSNAQFVATGTSGSTTDAAVGTAELIATAASETPGAFGATNFAATWSTATIAVPVKVNNADASTTVTATATATGLRIVHGDTSTPVIATVGADSQRTANVDALTTVTAGLTAAVARTTYASADSTVAEVATAAAMANYVDTADSAYTAGLDAAVRWEATAAADLQVTANLTCVAIVGPVGQAPITVTAATTAGAQRATTVDSTIQTTVATAADVARATYGDASTTVTAGLTAQMSTPADPLATAVTAGLTADAVAIRPIGADLVVTVNRSGRFSVVTSGHRLVTMTTTADAVVTPSGVKTVNGAQSVTATTAAAVLRNALVDAPTEVTAGLAAVMAAALHVDVALGVTAHLRASAWIVGQPVPHTPPDRTLVVSREDRSRVITADDRTQVAPADDRALEVLPA